MAPDPSSRRACRRGRVSLAVGSAIGAFVAKRSHQLAFAWQATAISRHWAAPAWRRSACRSQAAAPILPRPPVRTARGWAARGALPSDLGDGIFGLTMRANEAIGAGLDGGSILQLLPVLFLAGLLSSVNPCSAAALPAAVASVTALGRDTASVAAQAAAFAAGSGVVLAALGLAASALGEQLLPLDGTLQLLFPGVAVLMGLSLLGLLPLRLFGLSRAPELPPWLPRELQGFCLGVASAVGSSPCATPVLVTVVSFLAAYPQDPGTSAALFLSYALGYNAPVALAAAFAGSLPLLQGGSRLGVGTAQLIGLSEEWLLGPAPPGVLGATMAGVAATALALRAKLVPARSGTSEALPKAVPVIGEAGVYRYCPSAGGAPTASVQLAAGRDDDGRRAALAAVCLGSATSGFVKSGEAKPDSPAVIIKSMAESSPSLTSALQSGRPVVVDFSATWCSECLKLAPSLRQLEEQYGRDVTFVTMDVSYAGPIPGAPPPPDPDTGWWAREFGIDGIPHLAFVGADGAVRTALIGGVPTEILRADIEALRDGAPELPFVMYDAFRGGRKLRPPPSADAGYDGPAVGGKGTAAGGVQLAPPLTPVAAPDGRDERLAAERRGTGALSRASGRGEALRNPDLKGHWEELASSRL
eukprot:CAMPEP_0168490250 /NCGR_PEP_ID=MMETSP0228-20121227/69087_1 /TAXON_ID=133427 /ORGANISM="Protoceratium reticulatum, Strain CCCM 535 (=CCMP 1889)" /LENGTH=643 /DNA_ID=CAMNT_0008506957 /DNA_START=20 /DNA_END=1945 /DNA_ORIENTATION=+